MQRKEKGVPNHSFRKLTPEERWHRIIQNDNKPGDSNKRQIKIGIFDRSGPDGKIIGQHKKGALLKALFEMMYQELLSDANISPRFNWSGIFENSYRAVAADESSAEFLKDRVERMRPPWPGAKLEVFYKSKKLRDVEAYIPGELILPVPFFKIVSSLNSNVVTQRWKTLGIRPHNQGHVAKFSVDIESYRELERCNGFIPYMDSAIEFRMLKDDF